MTPEELVRAATKLVPVPFVPEITLRTATDPYELWEETGRESPPFWAFPWAGGQGLARYLLDNPDIVAEKVVLDVASGSGLVAIAAAMAGARQVTATDIDACALAAIALNATANDVTVSVRSLDLTATGPVTANVMLAADIFYDRDVATHALEFARHAVAAGTDVLLADPGRAFLPGDAVTEVGCLEVPVIRALEETDVKLVTVYRPVMPACLKDRFRRPRERVLARGKSNGGTSRAR
jgi:predicted nicotinamide N-methyase